MLHARSLIILGLIIAVISSITTYAWNHQTLDEMVEQNNREAIISCLTEARTKETAQAILQATTDCNSHLFTTVSSPLVSTGFVSTGTVNTAPISSEPLGFQLVPKASAKEIKSSSIVDAEITGKQKSMGISEVVHSGQTNTVENADIGISHIPRTPSQIFEQVKHLGYREAPTVALVKSCKEGSLDMRHCILFGLTLMYNEAGNMQNSKACLTRNNCFGINSGKKVYTSLDEGMDTWVVKYNKYWYKAQSASFFYPSAGNVSPSRYCTSESSSDSSIGCPHGLGIATKKWNQLYPIIY